MPLRSKLTAQMVKDLAASYDASYDTKYYFPYIQDGRLGDITAILKLTEWKNPGTNNRPMRFLNHKRKRAAWEYFKAWHNSFLKEGRKSFRAWFQSRSPVWAMFWHHVLFRTPIFDVNTNIAFHFFRDGNLLPRNDARIPAGGHWDLYDDYCQWFSKELCRLQRKDPDIDERMLDRALFMWGRTDKESLPPSCRC